MFRELDGNEIKQEVEELLGWPSRGTRSRDLIQGFKIFT